MTELMECLPSIYEVLDQSLALTKIGMIGTWP